MRTPKRGEIWWTKDFFNPENPTRPAVVVSSSEYSECRGDFIILPISTKIERAKCETDCILQDWRCAGLAKPSYVKCNPLTVKSDMLREFIGTLSDEDFSEVLEKLRQALRL